LSKLLERLVFRHLIGLEYLLLTDLIPPLQSGYRQGHALYRNCCITGALRLSDILQAVDNGDLAALALLYISAAFGTVDHSILLRRLHLTFSIDDTAHEWFQLYLSSISSMYAAAPASRRSPISGLRRAPKIRFRANLVRPVSYTVDLLTVIGSHELSPHMYADDTQVYYGSCRPSAVTTFMTKVSECELKQPHLG